MDRRKFNKENTYRKNITFLDNKGNKKYSAILRFKNKEEADNYTNKMSNVKVKDLGNYKQKKRKIQYNSDFNFKIPKFRF